MSINYLFVKLKKRIYLIQSFFLQKSFAHCGSKVLFESVGLILGEKYISIGNNTKFGNRIYLTAWNRIKNCFPQLEIGNNCRFGAMNHITCCNKIIIGDNLLTGKWVTITDNSHGNTDYESMLLPPLSREIISKGPIIIGKNVWIGDKATILPGVIIGNGVIIAANSVITKNIPPYSIAAGNPAKIIKTNKDRN